MQSELQVKSIKNAIPKRATCVNAHPRQTAYHDLITILKNHENHTYYQLSEAGALIWNLIDGKLTVLDLASHAKHSYPAWTLEMTENLVNDLYLSGFIDMQGYERAAAPDLPHWMTWIDGIRNIMEAEYVFPNVDAWITRTYQKYVKFFFALPVLIALLLFSVGGMISFINLSIGILPHLHAAKHLFLLLILADITGLLLLSLHELAHAYTTKYFGYEVHFFGVGWYWIGPVAFTDTSDMWLAERWQRIAVNIAGAFMDIILATVSTYCAFIAVSVEWKAFFWLYSLFTYVMVFRNLFPLMELDGYYILMDYFDHPRLREDSVRWLTEVFPKLFYRPVFTKEYKKEIWFWIICLIFISISPLIAFFIQFSILSHFIPILKEGWWRLILPTIAVAFSFITVWNDIQKQKLEQINNDSA